MHYVATIELTRPGPGPEEIDDLMDALADVHGTVSTSPAGNLELHITLPADDLRQALALALAVAERHGEVLTIAAAPEAVRDAREGWEPLPDLVNPVQAAQILTVSPQAVRDIIDRGELPHMRLGERALAIPRAAVDALARKRAEEK